MGKAQKRKLDRKAAKDASKKPSLNEAVPVNTGKSLAVLAAMIIIPLVLAVISFNRGHTWKVSDSLWGDVALKSPQKARGLSSFGAAVFKLGRIDEAIALYERAVVLKDDYAMGHYNLGLGYEAKGRLTEAVEEFKEAISLRDGYAKAFNALGSVYVKLKREREAIESYEEAVRLWPTYPKANYNLGTRYGEADRFEEAVRHLHVAIRNKPDYTKAYFNMGIFYARRGFDARAAEEFRKALELSPNDEAAQRLYKEYSAKKSPQRDLGFTP